MDASTPSLAPIPGTTPGDPRRTGYAARARSRRPPLPDTRRVGPLDVALSTGRKLLALWGSLAREHAPPARLARYQLRRLRGVLRDAEAHVPLYRERWARAGVRARDLETLEDLRRFPFVGKDDVRDRFPDGCLREGTSLSRCRIQQTSGSSGRCMEIALSLRCDDLRNVMSRRVYGWHGFRWHNRIAYLFPYRLPFENNLGIYRNAFVDATRPPAEIVARLEALRPVVLAATPSDVIDLLEGLPEGRDLRGMGLRALCLHSEPVSADERAWFEARFGCPVRTNYYCNEVWAIAAECAHGRLHELSDHVVLELVDDRGAPVADGEPGHVVVTGLHNRVQPFVRYRLGDVAVRSPVRSCPCGRPFPVLERVEGRDDDVFVHPDGRRIHPSRITVAVKSPCFAYPGRQVFRDYQVVQDAVDHVEVRLVPGRDAEPFHRCAREGARNLQRVLAPGVSVSLRICDVLEGGAGGKRKIFERAVPREGGNSC